MWLQASSESSSGSSPGGACSDLITSRSEVSMSEKSWRREGERSVQAVSGSPRMCGRPCELECRCGPARPRGRWD